ncbi:hypothetical protein AAG747_09740 [Rapidithrix thailandica]|uniref:HTH luxR-type domain-containing protein n=1 Tax=Rapidithrix thailandica TaxID=413964 RepID=A0AAW9S534_9BACT
MCNNLFIILLLQFYGSFLTCNDTQKQDSVVVTGIFIPYQNLAQEPSRIANPTKVVYWNQEQLGRSIFYTVTSNQNQYEISTLTNNTGPTIPLRTNISASRSELPTLNSNNQKHYGNKKNTILKITVLPPFWNFWWFWVLITLSFFLLIYGGYNVWFKVFYGQNFSAKNDEGPLSVEIQNAEPLDADRKQESPEPHLSEFSGQQLREELHSKHKELATYTLHTIHKNQLLELLKMHLLQLMKNVEYTEAKEFKKLVQMIDDSFDLDKEWEGFRMSFDHVYRGFVTKLRATSPQLTSNDVRLCSLYKMGLSSKEIATILGISLNSLKVARYRLRKKLSLAPEIDLKEFLNSLM